MPLDPAELGAAEAVGGDGPKSLKEAQGKVVILDFWGTFCEPCKKSFPKYQEIVDQFPGEVTVLAVSVDEPENVKKEQLVQFAKDNHAKFAIVWDKDHKAVEKYKPRRCPRATSSTRPAPCGTCTWASRMATTRRSPRK